MAKDVRRFAREAISDQKAIVRAAIKAQRIGMRAKRKLERMAQPRQPLPERIKTAVLVTQQIGEIFTVVAGLMSAIVEIQASFQTILAPAHEKSEAQDEGGENRP